MEFTVKGKAVEIKFNYLTMFKVDRRLATKNQETGESNNDGVGTLFNNIINQNDQGIVDLIMLSASKAVQKSITEEDALQAIADWLEANEAESTEALFDEIKEEMVASGFFKQKISKYIENMETALEYLQGQEAAEEMQIKAVETIIGKMRNALS